MRPRIRHRLPGIHLTVAETLGKNPTSKWRLAHHGSEPFNCYPPFDFLAAAHVIAFQRIPHLTGPVDNNDVTLQRNRNKTAGRFDGCYKNQSDSLMAADGDCHNLCKLMEPVRHRWSISDVIVEIRNTPAIGYHQNWLLLVLAPFVLFPVGVCLCNVMWSPRMCILKLSCFRTGHSTSTALLKVTEDIREALDKGQITILTLLDYSKAFDTVDVDLLIAKLRVLHFSDNALAWMDSYLRERQQCVYRNKPRTIIQLKQNIRNEISAIEPVLLGRAIRAAVKKSKGEQQWQRKLLTEKGASSADLWTRTKEDTSVMLCVACIGKKHEHYNEVKRSDYVFEMRIWRRMERVQWTDKIRNEAVLERVVKKE
ncbi:hypothetical protein ANN_00599 [Periplaneta americana]|uniref:Reverse transcriptase domain-containing protein n=1 Tax=Periplaneta americana TaxID=6978 RepID=A0ABQ8TRB9_PERAM|nr:hypothetical protein ANN_00599 [Periplaneta americana]